LNDPPDKSRTISDLSITRLLKKGTQPQKINDDSGFLSAKTRSLPTFMIDGTTLSVVKYALLDQFRCVKLVRLDINVGNAVALGAVKIGDADEDYLAPQEININGTDSTIKL